MKDLHCEFEKTGAQFKNRDIYKCKYCNIQLLLEDPDNAKVICFRKREIINDAINPKSDEEEIIVGLTKDNFAEHVFKHAMKKNNGRQELLQEIENIKNSAQENVLCSTEDIQKRLEICKSCEYYENDSCLMCGCIIVREANYKNKLANKGQSCPVGKWGPIKD